MSKKLTFYDMDGSIDVKNARISNLNSELAQTAKNTAKQKFFYNCFVFWICFHALFDDYVVGHTFKPSLNARRASFTGTRLRVGGGNCTRTPFSNMSGLNRSSMASIALPPGCGKMEDRIALSVSHIL